MNTMELLKKAYAGDTIQIDVDLGGVKARLDYISAIDMFADQKRFKAIRLAEWDEKGFGKKKINEREWLRDLEAAKPEHRENIEKEKPANLAEQFADEDAKLMVLRKLVPKYLTDLNGVKLFPTEPEQAEFGQLIMNSQKLMNELVSAVTELFSKIKAVSEASKNSPMPETTEKK